MSGAGTYRAIRMERFAPTFREAADIVELPLVAPGPGEIRVRNLHCGINAIFDTQIARNAVDYVPVKPPTLTGVEAVGIVEAVGDGVTQFAVGDPVATTRFRGGYREINIGAAADFVPIPAATRDYLALASTGVSAFLALERIGELRDGETIVISAAAGGLGHFLVQLAVLQGCRVIAVCSSGAKGDFVKSLGAERVIDYRTEDVSTVLAAEYPKGVDVAVDTVGGAVFDAFLANLAYHGRLVVGGAAQDLEGKPEMVTAPRIAHSIYYKGASVRGFMNGLLTPFWPAARARMFELYAEGKIAVTTDAVPFVGLESVYDAIERLLSGRSMGKVVVDL